MFQEIYVIDEQEELTEELKKMFKEEPNYRFKRILTKDMDYVSNNLPQLIIINDDTITKNTIELCTEIRKTEDNNIIPIIVLSSREDKEFKIDLAKNYVE